MSLIRAVASFVAVLAVITVSNPATAQVRVETGVLECTVQGATSFIIGSSRDLVCRFTTSDGRVESYVGSVNRFGIDIGMTNEGRLGWAVLAPSVDVAPGALAGVYGGLSAEAAIGVGAGANALIGGSNDAIVLQPISVQATEGAILALGIAAMDLRLLN
ncbi:MAG: DUF992 domain-containing protein [Pseudomonadota bacterium]